MGTGKDVFLSMRSIYTTPLSLNTDSIQKKPKNHAIRMSTKFDNSIHESLIDPNPMQTCCMDSMDY